MKAKKAEHRVGCLNIEGAHTLYVCYDMREFYRVYWANSAPGMRSTLCAGSHPFPHRVSNSSWACNILSGGAHGAIHSDNYKQGANR